MHVELLPQFILGFATSLAGVLVSTASVAPLRRPVGAIVFDVTTLPTGAVGAGRVSRLTLPSKPAGCATKYVGSVLRCQAVKHLATMLTGISGAILVLSVIFPCGPMNSEPLVTAILVAECMPKFVCPRRAASNRRSALIARLSNTSSATETTAFRTAILLCRMIARRNKHLATVLAGFGEVLANRLRRAVARAKAARPVLALFIPFTAEVTLFHASHYSIHSA
jgi:hypothetical protein